MKKEKKKLPKWSKWLMGLGIPAVVIAGGVGAYFGIASGQESSKAEQFTYMFDEYFQGYHRGTQVTVLNDGREYLERKNVGSYYINDKDDGYIYFDNRIPVSVRGLDKTGSYILHPGEDTGVLEIPQVKNDTDHDITIYKKQAWNKWNF